METISHTSNHIKRTSQITTRNETKPQMIPLNSIVVRKQVRGYFDPDKLQGLADSIREEGILQPLGVKPMGQERFLLIMGERRYRAAQMVGLSEVPVHIMSPEETNHHNVQVVENLQREGLGRIEQAEALLGLFAKRWDMPVDEARKHMRRIRKNAAQYPEEAERIASFFREYNVHWQSFIAAELRNLTLPEDVKELCRNHGMDITKARELAKVQDHALRTFIGERAVRENWPLTKVRSEVLPHLPPRRSSSSRASNRKELRDGWQSDIDKLPEARRKAVNKLLRQMIELMYPSQN